MTDYYPLIFRAVAGLERNNGENRRALYERARAALLGQLRGMTPPLPESDITRERLALEESIRKVEADAARKFRDQTGDPLAELAALIGAKDPLSEFRDSLPQGEEELRRRIDDERRRLQEEGARRFAEDQQRRKVEEARQNEEDQRRKQDEERRQQEKRRLSAARAELAEVASPAPSLAPDGRLDAGANIIYDTPTETSDLPALPIRQGALIQTILSDLPRNAPKHLRMSLENYADELKVRGVQPILGLLKDMAAIIEAAVGAPGAPREWLEEGMCEAFRRFADNHALFVKHFPLDPKREELYARMPVDENQVTGAMLSKPFENVAKATYEANKAGLTTDDFLKIVDKMAEFAKVISTHPPSSSASERPPSAERSESNDSLLRTPVLLSAGPEDRISPDIPPVSPKKRVLLSGFGFFERVYNLLGSSATLTGPAEGNALLGALREAISVLSKLIGF